MLGRGGDAGRAQERYGGGWGARPGRTATREGRARIREKIVDEEKKERKEGTLWSCLFFIFIY